MRGVLAGIALAACVVACVHAPEEPPGWEKHMRLENEIIALWTQIRDWRRGADMDLEPAPFDVMQMRAKPPKEVKAVCVNDNNAPKQCHDVCNLAADICDNMERICDLADQLGKGDDFAQQKCSSAKGSCREAQQRCCGCSKKDVTP